ncbi:hypothetical protein AB0J63_31540 [Streptosporangium canum]|uniref:hypothetical protein n=1 Tax=Streptosporangium canum TaxID=324952 RepID=UPI00342242AD
MGRLRQRREGQRVRPPLTHHPHRSPRRHCLGGRWPVAGGRWHLRSGSRRPFAGRPARWPLPGSSSPLNGFRLHHVGDLDGAWTGKEIVYGITSLPAEAAVPAHLNHYERAHWSVENRLHRVRDVTFREDHCQLRTGTAPRALAAFRNLAISTMRLADRANIAHARRDLLDHNAAFAVHTI